MSGYTVKWLIDELNKVNDKTRVIKIFEGSCFAKSFTGDVRDSHTIQELSGRDRPSNCPVIIYFLQ